MEREEIDIDNFIREKIKGFTPQRFAVEPTPDFAETGDGQNLSRWKRKDAYFGNFLRPRYAMDF